MDLDNLAAYVALRHHDLRDLQDQLSALGLSSLGRNESHVMAGIDAVLSALRVLAGEPVDHDGTAVAAARARARSRVRAARTELFGEPVGARATRVMVTLPADAASDADLVAGLIRAGTDAVRINTAHDDPDAWAAMAGHTRVAAAAAGRRVPVMMDLAGPKLRIGPIEDGPAVVRIKPRRDPWGGVLQPGRVALDGTGAPGRPAGRDRDGSVTPAVLAVDPSWLARLEVDDEVRVRDLRGRDRLLRVAGLVDGRAVLSCDRSCYLTEGLELQRGRERRDRGDATRIGAVVAAPGGIRVRTGDSFVLTRGPGAGCEALRDEHGAVLEPARVPCAEPTVVDLLAEGERVVIDDGRLEGVVRRVGRAGALVEVVRAPQAGLRLREDRGINLPDTQIRLPLLSRRDRTELRTIVAMADSIGCSFVNGGEEMAYLSGVVASHGGAHVGLVAKVETEAAVFHLPDILASVTGAHPLAVMIARGDLAVELGWERMAEYQQRILWFSAAAHVPVVWATQVLESMMRTGVPSRAELTDAGEAERADCVMLNKGPHAAQAVELLDSILTRMEDHVDQKRDLLPHLRHLD